MRRAAAILGIAAALAACGGSDSPERSSLLDLGAVEPAVAAVEQSLGGPQRYTEINVGADLVNLFVAVGEATEVAYVYRDGGLEPPAPPGPIVAGATPFTLDDVDLDKVAGFEDLLRVELPDSVMVRLALLDAPPIGLGWQAGMRSSKGGSFQVAISPQGDIVGALPGSAAPPTS